MVIMVKMVIMVQMVIMVEMDGTGRNGTQCVALPSLEIYFSDSLGIHLLFLLFLLLLILARKQLSILTEKSLQHFQYHLNQK